MVDSRLSHVVGPWSLEFSRWTQELIVDLWSLLFSLVYLSVVGCWSLVIVRWWLGVGHWLLIARFYSLVARVGRWSLVPGRWSLVAGLWSSVICQCLLEFSCSLVVVVQFSLL